MSCHDDGPPYNSTVLNYYLNEVHKGGLAPFIDITPTTNGLRRTGEFNESNGEILLSMGATPPAEIAAFNGDSFNVTATQPPGNATLRDFYGVTLSSGQIDVTIPTGIGFKGTSPLTDFDLSINIRSGTDRVGNCGPFASFNWDDYLLIESMIRIPPQPDPKQDWSLKRIVSGTPVIQRFKGGVAQAWYNVGHSNFLPCYPALSLSEIGDLPDNRHALLSQGLFKCTAIKPAGPAVANFEFPGTTVVDEHPGPAPTEFGWVPDAMTGHVASASTASQDPINDFAFTATIGVTEKMYYNCASPYCSIEDENGTITVYSNFEEVSDEIITIEANDADKLSVNFINADDESMFVGGISEDFSVHRLKAFPMYKQYRNGYRVYYLRNNWGQLKGFRDSLGREIVFEYGALGDFKANRIERIVDQFGRETILEYNEDPATYPNGTSYGTLMSVRLPQVTSGAPGQPVLDRVINLDISYNKHQPLQWRFGDEFARIMKGLAVSRPLDVTGPSFVANFTEYPPVTGTNHFTPWRSRVAAIQEQSSIGPAWMSGVAGGATTYTYDINATHICPPADTTVPTTGSIPPEKVWVEELRPDGSLIRHWFDNYGNEVLREESPDGSSFGLGTRLTQFEYDGWHAVANLLTKVIYPEGNYEAYKYQFSPAGSVATSIGCGWWDSSNGGVLEAANVVETIVGSSDSSDPELVTVKEYGKYSLVKRERSPGTPFGEWDYEHDFDYEDGALFNDGKRAGAVVRTTLRAVGGAAAVREYETNVFGQVLSATDALGRVTEFSYHPMNDPDGDLASNWPLVSSGVWTSLAGYQSQEVVDPGSGTLNLTTETFYDDRGLPTKIVDPRLVPSFTAYNEMDQAFVEGTGSWSWNATRDDLVLDANPDGASKTYYIYDANGNVVESRAWNDNPDLSGGDAATIDTKFIYDGLDQLVETQTELLSPLQSGTDWVHTYWVRDALGRVELKVGTDNSATQVTYDLFGQVTNHRAHYALVTDFYAPGTHAEDVVTSFAYDGNGNMASASDSEYATETLHYDGYGRRIGKTGQAPGDVLLVHELNPNGLVEEVAVYPTDATIGNYTSKTPLKKSEFSYDERYRFTKREDHWPDHPSGQATIVTTEMEYDLEDQIVKVTDDDGEETGYKYDNAGRLYEMTHPGGIGKETYDLDDAGNRELLTVEEAVGSSTVSYEVSYGYDLLGREVWSKRGPGTADESESRSWYDSLGNLTRSATMRNIGIVGNKNKYDSRGLLVESSDGYQVSAGAGNWTFGGAYASEMTSANPDGLVTIQKEYSDYGDLIKEVDDVAASHATQYTYDNLHRREEVIYADGTKDVVEYRRDSLIDRLEAFDATGSPLFEITYGFDAAKRKTTETYYVLSGPYTGMDSKWFGHDELGRVTLAKSWSSDPVVNAKRYRAETSRVHDTFDRVVQETEEFWVAPTGTFSSNPDFSVTVDTEHDAYSNLTSIKSSIGTDPNGLEITRAYVDPMHRLTAVNEVRSSGSAISAAMTWRGAGGRLDKIVHGNGTTTNFASYDLRGRLLEQKTTKDSDSSVIGGRAWEYGPSSVQNLERRLGIQGDDHAYTHDAFDRLVELREGTWDTQSPAGFSGPVELERLTLDGAGSTRTNESGTEGGALASFTATTDTTNHYTTFGSTYVSRDERGDTIEIGDMNLAFDVLGHLVGTIRPWVNPIVPAVEIRDAFDRRVYRSVSNIVTMFTWVGDELIQESEVTGVGSGSTSVSVKKEYVHGFSVDYLLGQRVDDGQGGSDPFTFYTSPLSTPIACADDSGVWAERYDIDPYGGWREEVNTASFGADAIDNRIGMAGAWYGPVEGLYYMRARHYSPLLKRFVSRDPIGVWGDAINRGNAYGYVGNSPTALSDPAGLGFWSKVASIAKSAASSARDAAAGAIDGAISGVTLGYVETSIAADTLGANKDSGFYAAGSVVGDIAGGAVLTAATGGGGALARGVSLASKVVDVKDGIEASANVGAAFDAGLKEGLVELAKASAGAAAGKAVKGQAKTSSKPSCADTNTGQCFVEGTLVWTPDGLVPIEAIEVGDRVCSTSGLLPPEYPGEEESLRSLGGPWLAVDLVLNPSTSLYKSSMVTVLRPSAWFQGRWGTISVGDVVRLTMDELEIDDPAKVVGIEVLAAPAGGPGELVLTTTRSLTASVRALEIESLSGFGDRIVGTRQHLIYSKSDGCFVELGNLARGSRLGGPSSAVVRDVWDASGEVRPVFNLEVAETHCFVVGLGVLAHNSCQKYHGNDERSTKSQHTYRIVDTYKDDDIVKVGLSGQKLNSNGTPRGNKQANEWNNKEEGGNKRYRAEVVDENVPGRKKGLRTEKKRTGEADAGGHSLRRHKYPKPPSRGG